MVFLNTTSLSYSLISGFTENVTGSLALTLLIILIMFILIGLIFRLSLEFMILILSPIVFLFAVTDNSVRVIGVIWLLLLGGILLKNFWLKT